MALDMSALYRTASRAALKAAESQFAASPFGQLHRTVNATLSQPKRAAGIVSRMARQAVRPSPNQVAKKLIGVDPTHLVSEVRKYARGDQLAASLVKEFLGSLGPAGKIIQALASGTGQQPDLEAMADILTAHGYTVLPPEAVPGMAKPPAKPPSVERAIERAGVGRRRQRPGKNLPLPMASGKTRYFPRDHPIMTGEMVKASSSTNVHSFGYKAGSWTLFVRFWAGTHRNKHAGPMYAYYQVTPEQFLAMYKVRGAGDKHTPGVRSPGTFVWEKLRILGTVSGHQVDYKLVGVARGYVPRKAVFAGAQEEYRPRIFKTAKGGVLRSELPAAVAGFPNRGTPNRGTPNRGTP